MEKLHTVYPMLNKPTVHSHGEPCIPGRQPWTWCILEHAAMKADECVRDFSLHSVRFTLESSAKMRAKHFHSIGLQTVC